MSAPSLSSGSRAEDERTSTPEAREAQWEILRAWIGPRATVAEALGVCDAIQRLCDIEAALAVAPAREPSEKARKAAMEMFYLDFKEPGRALWPAMHTSWDKALRAAYAVDFGAAPDRREP
jgi:hypothetical protein